MSAQKIQTALGLLQDNPDNEPAWDDLAELVTSPNPGLPESELKSLLEAARRGHEIRREWDAVARVLELEAMLHAGTPVELAMQFELSRVLDEECFETAKAEAVYARLLEIRPGEDSAQEALARHADHRARFQSLVARHLEDAQSATEPSRKSAAYFAAADLLHRFGGGTEEAVAGAVNHLEEALAASRKNERAAALLERIFQRAGRWEDAARIAEIVATTAVNKEARVAALVRIARISLKKLGSEGRAGAAYERVLDLWPGHSEAMSHLAGYFSNHEQWDHLVALYEDQLRGGGAKPGEEAGIIFQIAMVHWRMRQDARAAEPWFDRLRRLKPAHRGMLDFFREHCSAEEGRFRLMTVLSDAQRAMPDGPEKATLAAEIAKLAEEGANARKAIEQYKTLLRSQPDNEEAHQALKRLYVQTEGWNALIELLRQELDRVPADDVEGRASVLREIAKVYRDHIKSDTALVTVLSQLVQLDESDLGSLRELLRAYEALGRFRDLLNYQGKLAKALPPGEEKTALLRSVARRWADQFSNVQNATEAYEALLEVEPSDEEAISKLRELYAKRRAFPQLYSLYERELPTKQGADRNELLAEMAKLAAERLDRGADAIRLYKEILEAEPSRLDILDALERQAEREKDFVSVTEALELRLSLLTDEASRIAILQKMGTVFADRLSDHAGAARAFRRVLEIQPGHGRALRVLRDAYVSGGDFDGLSELYASQNDWEGLAEVLSNAADRAEDPELKVALSFRAADVFVEKIGSPERAFRSYERVLSVRPDDLRAAEALIPLYEKDDKWARLPSLYEVLLGHAEEAEKPAIFERLVEITGKRLNDAEAALGWAKRAYEELPGPSMLEMLEAASRAAKSWDAYIASVEGLLAKKGKKKPKAFERRALRIRLAELHANELGRIDEAIASYRSLVEEDPDDAPIVESMERLLRAADRRDELRWLFDLRAERASDEIKAEILVEWAGLEEDAFGDPARASSLYRRALEAVPGHANSLRALERLLLAAGDSAGLAEVLEQHRDVVAEEAKASHELLLAGLYADNLGRHEEALGSAARALELSPGHARALAIVERLLASPETRARAAELLEREYALAGDATREARALSVLLESAKEGEKRLKLFTRLSELKDEKLHAPSDALDVTMRALAEFPGELSLWDRAAELAERAVRPLDLVAAYRFALAPDSQIPESLEIELCERAATLHDEKLGDPEAATPYLKRVLARDPADERAFARLKQILTSYERWEELEAVYEQAARATTDPSRRVELLHEVALVCEEITNEPKKAIVHYERIVDLEPLHETAVRALDRLYEKERLYPKLAASLSRRLEMAGPDETISLKLRLGRLGLEQLGDTEGALSHLEDVLRLDAKEAEARSLVERILESPDLRLRAAEALEAAYDAQKDARRLSRVLEIQLEAAEEEAERRELLHRIAELRDERLGEELAAFDAYARLLPLDPLDHAVRQRMVELGRRLGEHSRMAEVLEKAASAAEASDLASELLLEVARIFEDFLGEPARAETMYRRALAIDPHNPQLALPAARELERLYAASGKHAELAEILQIESDLEDDIEARRLLLFRLAELYETALDDPSRAIASLRKRLEDDPSDDDALSALQGLYERTASFSELSSTLEARADLVLDPDLRKELMTQRARLLSSQLGDSENALFSWQALRDEFGPDSETLSALALLYEKAERWGDLAATLEEKVSLSDEPRQRLELLARLGELRHSRQSDGSGALEALREALTLDPSHAPSRAALEKLLEAEEARREAAALLHPLYEADGDHARLLDVIEIEIAEEDEAFVRLALFEQAVRLAEGPLGNAERALDHALRALRDAAPQPELPSWIERAESLALRTNRFAELFSTLREISDDVLDGQLRLDLTLKLAELAKERLDDRELSREHFVKALDLEADEPRALLALEALYEEAGDEKALLDILRRRSEASLDDSERKTLLYRQAKLFEALEGELESAIATYEQVLDIVFDDDSVAALERLYAKAERFGDLVGLHERKLDKARDGKAEIHVRIAKLHYEKLSEHERAFESIEEALRLEPRHEPAVSFLEGLLEVSENPEERGRAAELLEPIYLQSGEYRRVIAALEARVSASDDAHERRPLLRRLANLQEEQAEDFAAALETTAKLFHDDIGDDEIRSELERLAKMAGSERRLAEIYEAELSARGVDDETTASLARRAGELHLALGEAERALSSYKQALAFDPDSRPVFDAIDKLLQQAGRHEERAELHRDALDHRFEPETRLATLHALAEIEQKQLSFLDKAIETYRAILDIDERDTRALDALTTLFREREQHADLAELYELRAEQATTVAAKAELRLSLARLYRDELSDPTRALDEYERIIESTPNHTGALADLEVLAREGEHAPRAVEVLQSVYEKLDDWRRLVALQGQRFALAEDDAEKVAILGEVAKLWEDRGSDLPRALGALEEALEIDPNDGEIRAELERIVELLEAWEDLAEFYERVLERAEPSVQHEMLATLAKVHDERRGDFRAALNCFRRLSALDELDPEPLEAADELALLLGDWQALTEILSKKVELAVGDDERASLHRRVADIRRDMLDDGDGAISAYEKALEIQGENVALLDCLIALFEPKNDAARLVDLYSRRIELAGPSEAELSHGLLRKAADRFEKDLGDAREAIDRLHRALEIRPNDHEILTSLSRLLEAEELWPDLLDNLKLQASMAETSAERARFRKEIAKLHSSRLDNPEEAVDTYSLVLDETPSDEEAVFALLDLGESDEELRLSVASVLEPVLRATSQWESLIRALSLRLAGQADRHDRARTLQSIAIIEDESLQKSEAALSTLLGALLETPEDSALHEEIERLAALSDGWARYADSLDERANAAFDGVLAKELFARLGKVSASRIEDDARAIAAYSKAIELGGDDAEILSHLDALYLQRGMHEELASVLERRIDIEAEPSVQADLLHRLGKLQIEELADEAQGLVTLKQAIERAPDHAGAREALEALADDADRFEEIAEILEEIYREQGDNDRLTTLFEKRISFASDPSERVKMRLDLARLLEDRTADTKRAQKILEDALADAPTDPTLLEEIERLAAIHDGFQSAARKLGAAIADAEGLSSQVIRDTWLKIAGFYEDKLRDEEGAEMAFEKALEQAEDDLEILRALERARRREGRERELILTLRRISELESDGPTKRELLREAKLLAVKIEESELAEEILRQLLEDDGADLWALEELSKIRNRAGDAKEVVSLLLRRAELLDDSAAIALRHEAAELARTQLEDPAQAILLLEGILEMDAADERAGKTLRELYAETERHTDLAALLGRLAKVATTPRERAQLRLELAKIQAEKLSASSDAIDTLRTALEEDSGDSAAVVYLSGLYEAAHRDEDLAELLSSQIALAKSRNDAAAELSLTIRLAEMRESRLHEKAKAIEAYRAALVCDPSHRGALSALARLLEEEGEYAEAAKVVETLLAESQGEELVELALRLSELHGKAGDDEGSRRALEKALEAEPWQREAREKLAALYERTKAWGHLASLLSEDAERAKDPAEQVALYRRAAELHLHKRSDAAEAATLLEKASELLPEDRELLLLLCDAYSASGRGKDAAAALEKIVASFAGRRTKELATVHLRLSRAYRAEGDLPRALVELDQAFRIDPGSITTLKELGALSLQAGDLEKAQRTYRALLLQKLEPGGPITKGEVFYHLGEISHRLGDKTRALQMLERALENESTLDKARELLEELKK